MKVVGPKHCPCEFAYDDDGQLWRMTDNACPFHGSWITEVKANG